MATKFQYVTCTPTAVDADGVCASQSPGSGAITIDGALASGGVATLGAAQLIRLTSGGNDSGITFTFTGTDADGNAQTQTVAGTNASNSDTTLFFKTITGITASGAVAGTIVVGNLITSVSPTLRLNTEVNPFNVGLISVLVSGTATWDVNVSYGDSNAYYGTWVNHASLTSKSATADGSQLFPVAAVRLKLSASSSGVVRLQAVQAGA